MMEEYIRHKWDNFEFAEGRAKSMVWIYKYSIYTGFIPRDGMQVWIGDVPISDLISILTGTD